MQGYHKLQRQYMYNCLATDDNRVYSAVQQFGGTVVMTDPNHLQGRID